MADVMIATPNGQMPAYVATPAGSGPWPGVVVIHDFTGMSHDLRNQADWLAGEGFLTAAPDLYYWGSRLRCLWTIMREVTAGKGRTVADIDAAREWLSARRTAVAAAAMPSAPSAPLAHRRGSVVAGCL
jgi:carboxymethylenebutenolidase